MNIPPQPTPQNLPTRPQRRAAREEQERRAWRLRQQGWTITRIAEVIGVHESTAKRYIAIREAEVKERFLQDSAHIKADHLGKLELLYEELLTAYYRSCEDAVEVTTGLAALNQRTGEVVELPDKTVRRGQAGQSSILLAAAKILDDARKITGANAPEKIEIDMSDDMAMATLQKKMEDLAKRTIVEEDRRLSITVDASEEETPREQLKVALDQMKARKTVEQIQTLPASVRAETATAGIDLDGYGDGFTPE